MTETELPHYRLLQLGAPNRNGVQGNEPFETLDDLVTHHPGANRESLAQLRSMSDLQQQQPPTPQAEMIERQPMRQPVLG